ncbi:MAG: UDP-glucose/GDP-mannose dehydrogenase family protein [Actinomycetota bacterium]|nr:UDP-glucose/GDP-mannose dehydrogenase family protein [Actinomycetota bacterium]
MSRIAIIGVGYVGLTTSAALAHLGHQVVAADIDGAKIDLLASGSIPIVETGLLELVTEQRLAGRLTFAPMAGDVVADAEFTFLCVPTPQSADGSADLTYVTEAARQVGPHLQTGAVVVNKSTVPVGSVDIVSTVLGRPDVSVVSNPEFLREGRAVYDCLNPDRIVIGSADRIVGRRVAALYDGLDAPVVLTDPASAETVKYACNAFLATKVSFINEVANLCQAVGADVGDVVVGMGLDRRIGADHLKPGPGWGGSCFPKDTNALVRIAANHGYDFALVRGAIVANEAQFARVADRVAAVSGGDLDGVQVGVWGLTFKAGTDDLRDSPSLSVIAHLRNRGARVIAYDPTQPDPGHELLAPLGVEVVADLYAACEGSECVVVLTEWPEFAMADFTRVASVLGAPIGVTAPLRSGLDLSEHDQRRTGRPAIIDARNLLDSASVTTAGCRYEGIGRR